MLRTKMTGIFAMLLIAAGCTEEPPQQQVVLPTQFATSITVEEGTVTVEATAVGANFYTILFVEGTDSTLVENTTGEASYTYTGSGTYTVRSRAHALYDEYVEINDMVEVVLDPVWTGGLPTTGYTTPDNYPGYTLVWQDEFDGTELSDDWVYDIGTGSWGWGNNELQYYREENLQVADGYLLITAKQEPYGSMDYTSSRIKTQGHQSFEKGRIDIRAALPYGKGMWPALWMLGDNFSSVGWPSCGEIDIMEMVGGEGAPDRTIYGTAHWDNAGSHASYGGSKSLSDGKMAEEWHVFSIVWDDSYIRWYMDDVQYQVIDITPGELSEFHAPFFLLINLAVGGNWPGSPDGSTVFPQLFAVDYVRVFQ